MCHFPHRRQRQTSAEETPVTASELRAALAILHWSQREAALKLQVAPRLFRYWCSGSAKHPIPTVAALAIELLLDQHKA